MTLPLPLALATQNADKAREIVEVFVGVTGTPLGAYCVDTAGYLLDAPDHLAGAIAALPILATPPDVEETGTTLEANARIKAKAIADALATLAISDDTGLEVDALNGAPGVYSARFAGAQATYADNVAKLLRALEGTAPPLRTARFSTVAMACWPDGREVAVRGTVEGVITATARGGNGFGYNPVFAPV